MKKSFVLGFVLLNQLAVANTINMDDLFRKSIDDFFLLDLHSSPETMSDMGILDEQHRWDDVSDKAIQKKLKLLQDRVLWLKSEISYAQLSKSNKFNYDLYINTLEREIQKLEQIDETYLVYNSDNYAEMAVYTLTNLNKITDVKSARAYISRLSSVDEKFDQFEIRVNRMAANNFLPPKFIYPALKNFSKSIISGVPFSEGKDSPLLADFKRKLEATKISEEDKKILISECEDALKKDVKRAFSELIVLHDRLETLASDKDGLVHRPNGAKIYDRLVKYETTTNLTANEIHETGLREVTRIQNEMMKVKEEMGFSGTKLDLFNHMRNSQSFYLPNNDEGKEELLSRVRDLIETAKQALPDYFINIPKADVLVRKVEPFQEGTAPTAFYYWPSLDGSRPGYYYLNLKDMSRHNLTKMNAVAIHEALPGHHMQMALELELKDLPEFRKKVRTIAAFQEGWGLYSEYLGKEMGLYRDHWSDLGRLNMELWRAIRLVVDSGIHAKGWSREKARQFAFENSGEKEVEIAAEIDRFTLWPGQATGYKIGMIKIMEHRARAEKELGNRFDLREFHDVVLRNGTIPMNLLEKEVNNWIQSK